MLIKYIISKLSFNHFIFFFSHLRLPLSRLFDFICRRSYFDECEAARFISQLLTVTQYLHNCRIAHLDIKVTYNSYISSENFPKIIVKSKRLRAYFFCLKLQFNINIRNSENLIVKAKTHVGCVMVNVLVSSMVDRRFEYDRSSVRV